MSKLAWFAIRFHNAVSKSHVLSKLSASALRLLYVLEDDCDNQTGAARELESLREAAKAAGNMPYRTALRAMKELSRHGLVAIAGVAMGKDNHPYAGRGRGQRWRLLIPGECATDGTFSERKQCATDGTFSERKQCATDGTLSGEECAKSGATMCHGRHIQDERHNISDSSCSNSLSTSGSESNKAPTPAPPPAVDWFDKFWSKYPPLRRIALKDCQQFWRENHLDDRAKDILAGLRKWRDHPEWLEQDGRFVPKPLKFLEDRKWEAAKGLTWEDEPNENGFDRAELTADDDYLFDPPGPATPEQIDEVAEQLG